MVSRNKVESLLQLVARYWMKQFRMVKLDVDRLADAGTERQKTGLLLTGMGCALINLAYRELGEELFREFARCNIKVWEDALKEKE